MGENFARMVRQYGDRNAVISRHQGERLTYHELDLNSNVVAHGLQSLGVRKGDRVCVSLGNNLEFAVITYALFKLGAILVPLNPSFGAPQICSALNHLESEMLVIGAETNLAFKPPRSNIPIFEQIVPDFDKSQVESELIPTLKRLVVVDNAAGRVDPQAVRAATQWKTVAHDRDVSPPTPDAPLDAREVVNIQFTSGTTSAPKAACLAHRSILNNGIQIGDRMLLTDKDVVCCPPPLFHCFGSILGYMAAATHGSAILFPAEAFDPLATLRAIQEEKATALYGVPTMFLAELELIANGTVEHTGFEHLRTGIAAGSSVPAELMRRLHKVLNLTELTICYGMTETSPVSCMTTTDDPLEKRINTVGRLLPHVEAKVVDPNDWSRTLEIDEPGELAVHGYLVMTGYWGPRAKTDEVMVADREGKMWMHTGDEASMDAEGYVSITGRIKDLIIRGGENIHPLEVENCLLSCPRVAEVSVVGVPDERHGEAVAAFVIRRPPSEDDDSEASSEPITIDEVRAWVRERLSHHLVPKWVFFVGDFPKTASGKIQKFKLVELGKKMMREAKKD